ncbi:MAG: OmpH family outer membrane protein [Bacteroidales bacterium]|jgi:outer membrane protein|nr:OmpH family outer membrane protein [Bacteroidales bacterium]
MRRTFIIAVVFFAAVVTASAQKFAYVDSEFILENIPEYADAKAEIDELSIQWQRDIEAKFSEIDQLYKNFKAEAVLLPEDIKNKREEEIIAKEKVAKDLQKQRFGKDGDLFKRRQELIKPIQEKIYSAIESLAATENYAVIFDKAGSVSMMYTNPRYDISEEVLDKLGYSYKSRQ